MRALIDTRGVATPSFELVTHSELKANDGLRGFLVAPRCSLAAALVLAAVTGPAFGQRPAVSPNEIRIGATSPITGPSRSSQGHLGLFRQGQCRGRDQRPQDQHDRL